MKTIFSLTFKSASRDPFLLLWSLILPIGGAIGLGIFIKSPDLFRQCSRLYSNSQQMQPFSMVVNALRGAFNLSWSDYFVNTGLVLLVAIVAFLLALKTFKYTDV